MALAKSLLTSKVLHQVQSKVAEEIASAASMQGVNDILTKLISFSVLQIEQIRDAKASGIQSIVFDQALMIVVYLTYTRPQVQKETRSMAIRRLFSIDFDTMVQLKDYLQEQLTLEKSRGVDLKRQRMVLVSLTTIMCEFDTLSDTGEVLTAIYQVISNSFHLVEQALVKGEVGQSQFIFLLRVIFNNLRGLFQGLYRSR